MKLETEETHLELDQMRLKLKDRETQLKSANEFLESLTHERVHEREDDQLKISKLTQELKEERRSRNLEKAVIEELHEQVRRLIILYLLLREGIFQKLINKSHFPFRHLFSVSNLNSDCLNHYQSKTSNIQKKFDEFLENTSPLNKRKIKVFQKEGQKRSGHSEN